MTTTMNTVVIRNTENEVILTIQAGTLSGADLIYADLRGATWKGPT